MSLFDRIAVSVGLREIFPAHPTEYRCFYLSDFEKLCRIVGVVLTGSERDRLAMFSGARYSEMGESERMALYHECMRLLNFEGEGGGFPNTEIHESGRFIPSLDNVVPLRMMPERQQ